MTIELIKLDETTSISKKEYDALRNITRIYGLTPEQEFENENITVVNNHVIKFTCSRRNIETIPPCIKDIEHLTELYLGSNRITELSDELFTIPGIKKFGISNNFLEYVPPRLLEWKDLDTLFIDNNPCMQKHWSDFLYSQKRRDAYVLKELKRRKVMLFT